MSTRRYRFILPRLYRYRIADDVSRNQFVEYPARGTSLAWDITPTPDNSKQLQNLEQTHRRPAEIAGMIIVVILSGAIMAGIIIGLIALASRFL